ncbi:MAG: 2-keto-4-pentenoate hydratase/2-oxohepta-3-ene-1,7-dioic acid hydratase in catechol pathway [Gammaproteobacteria bacterium]|jgi:2-keto-4-pentenoate hydratase/2-oxohepta-3-ene-1,7-dioic acid hydratase in catechol pathway
MKLVRYGENGSEKPGLIDGDGNLRDLSSQVSDIDGSTLDEASLAKLRAIDPSSLPAVSGSPRLGCPVANIGKVLCIGLNFSDHAKESGLPIPDEPILFMKATTSLNGPNDQVVLPKGSVKSDWEVELGIVIGKRASYVEEADALDYVAGYTLVNDVSEREHQIESTGQWVKGKSADTFCPVGPWVLTADEVADPQALGMWLDLNGKRMQDGSSATQIFGVKTVVSYVSRYMTLMPGDIIPTGTPPGVGMGMNPQVFLKAGDVMRLGISGLGEQEQKVVAHPG